MKKTFLLFLFSFSIFHFTSAQNPLVKMWDKRFGGAGVEILTCFEQTKDGGFILGGLSYSGIGDDITQQNWGGADYWVIKIDSLGNKQWDSDFGGYDRDELWCIQQTSDGGYILGGFSWSGVGGSKTDSNRDTIAPYTSDYWVIKIDSVGVKEWDRTFGGDRYEYMYDAEQLKDGGYILGGFSNSEINGDKTQSLWGGTYSDYWIVKIDSAGNKIWDKDYGGTHADELRTMTLTPESIIILGGESFSQASGDKTQSSWGVGDYWILAIDSAGNKLWDQDFGSTNTDRLLSLEQTSDKGFILGGVSSSPAGGTKTQNTWGDWDYWIVKTDSAGNKIWDRDFGGVNGEDEFGSVSETFDHGFIFSGMSSSQASGNKSENNLSPFQSWMLKIDSTGSLAWDKTIFTSPEIKLNAYSHQSTDGCYVVAQYTAGGIAGYKSQLNRDTLNGSSDYWIIKFCDSTFIQANLATTTAICPGSCIDFTNLSFNASSYQWSFPNAFPDTSTAANPTTICYQAAGSYDVQLIAYNNNSSDTLLLTDYITVYPSPDPQSITQSGDTLFAIAGSTSYQWFFNGTQINGATNYFYVAPASGNYNVVATDTNGCEVEAAILNVLANAQSPVGSWQFAVYPNPVTESLSVNGYSLSGGYYTISIYNTLGDLVVKPQTSNLIPIVIGTETSIDVSGLSPGMYWLELFDDNSGERFRTKFLKQ